MFDFLNCEEIHHILGKKEEEQTKSSSSIIRHKGFFRLFVHSSVTLRVPPLKSQTGWTGELWSKTNLLNWQN